MICAGVVADAEDGIRVVEVFQRDRALANSNRVRQADTRRLMAHIGAIGKIVGAEFPGKELVEKRGFV